MSFSSTMLPTYCINLWWPNIIIQDLGICFDGRFRSFSPWCTSCSLILRKGSAMFPLRIVPCHFYPYLYFAVRRTWRKDLILVGPRLTQEPRPEETVASAAFQTSTPTFPVAAPQQGEAGKLRPSRWDVDIHQAAEMPRLPTERWSLVPVLEPGFLHPGNSAHTADCLCDGNQIWTVSVLMIFVWSPSFSHRESYCVPVNVN